MNVSILIPAYNEQERLEPFLKTIVSYLNRHRDQIREVIVIDDGSTDATAQIAARYERKIPSLKVVRHAHNLGKGAAVRTGVFAAKGEYVVFMDADGATDIGELPKMIAALTTSHIGVGNRWMKGAHTTRHSWLRRLSGLVYRTYMRLFGLGNIDTMCGFKGYRREVARHLFGTLLEPRWLFDTEVAARAIRHKYTITNFPIRWESKDGSKLSSWTLLKSAWQIWPLLSRVAAAENKRSAAPQTTRSDPT